MLEVSAFYNDMGVVYGKPFAATMMLVRANILTILPAGMYFMTQGTLDLSTFILFLVMGVGVNRTVWNLVLHLSMGFHQVSEAMKCVDAMFAVPSLPEPVNPMQPAGNTLLFKGVSFTYKESEVLHGVNLSIAEGTTTALVGPSGAGKTTLARLVARFWDVTEGSISLGGVDIREIEVLALLDRIAFVFQEVFLFNDSIFENIRVGKPGATEEEIIAAAQLAKCHEFIEALPGGYQYQVGENGTRLSGGQRQRVSIARAILKNASIVILDEATDFVDPENESLIQEALANLMHSDQAHPKTSIIVAHRLSTITDVDNIVVVDDGQIVGQGKHKQLLESSTLYHSLWMAHTETPEWRKDVQKIRDSATDRRRRAMPQRPLPSRIPTEISIPMTISSGLHGI